MKEIQFVQAREGDWLRWDEWLGSRTPKEVRQSALPFPAAEMPHRFRELCRDLSLSRDRNYSSPLVDRLHERVLRAQQRIYGAQPRQRGAWLRFLTTGFPSLVRREWRYVVPATLLLLLPLALYVAAAQIWPESVYLVLPGESAAQMEEMYAPDAPHVGRTRDAGTDFAMLGVYIWNNVRIDFQCFAGGIVFGLGSIFYLFFNGLFIGAVAGHLTRVGYGETFWTFVAGHSSFELIGAILSGAAGLRIGYALIAPGQLTRLAAVRRAARTAVRLLYGAAAMTFAAAFVEAFWSPQRAIAPQVKYVVGISFWIAWLAYFAFAGLGREAESGDDGS
jgi:uncharacterized membrane protein SpoIIM required for sporulation